MVFFNCAIIMWFFHNSGIVCLPRVWNCVCSVLSPRKRNCNVVSAGTEQCVHDLCGMVCLWFSQAQACVHNFVYVAINLVILCIINVLCIVMQYSASRVGVVTFKK